MLLTTSDFYILIVLHYYTYTLTTILLITLLIITNNRLIHLFTINLYTDNKFLKYMYILLLASLIGLPPFLGFWTKLYILTTIGKFGTLLLNLLAIITTLLSLIFYISALRYVISESTVLDMSKLTYRQYKVLCVGIILISVGSLYLLDFHLFLYTIFY
jgi:NADH:ubiquinone oxidoreductase subunit 2 (subunit N)